MTTKRTRRTRSELRQMMLSAGKEVLLNIEPSLGFEQLTYSAVFDHLQTNYDQRVTIGSVHERIWKNQRDFQLDVVAALLDEPVIPTTNLALDRAFEAIAHLDLSTPVMRRYALQTAVRMNSQLLFSGPFEDAINIVHQVRFRLWALGPDHVEAEGFTEALIEIRKASMAAYMNVANSIVAAIGLRVRPQAGDPIEAIETLVMLSNAVSVGLQTDVLEQSSKARKLPTGLNGELEEWHLDAIALWSYVTSTLELDGDGLTADERRL